MEIVISTLEMVLVSSRQTTENLFLLLTCHHGKAFWLYYDKGYFDRWNFYIVYGLWVASFIPSPKCCLFYDFGHKALSDLVRRNLNFCWITSFKPYIIYYTVYVRKRFVILGLYISMFSIDTTDNNDAIKQNGDEVEFSFNVMVYRWVNYHFNDISSNLSISEFWRTQ